MWRKPKLVALAVCTLLAVIVAAQNTESVDTRLLFVTVTMPRALLLIITLLIGTATGLLVGTRLGSNDPKQP